MIPSFFIRNNSNLFEMMQNFLKFDTNIFLKEICQKFIHLFANNMKGWSHKLEIWCVEQSGPALKKTRK